MNEEVNFYRNCDVSDVVKSRKGSEIQRLSENRLLPIFSPDLALNSQIWCCFMLKIKVDFLKKLGTLLYIYSSRSGISSANIVKSAS